jgi:hypothetical protein
MILRAFLRLSPLVLACLSFAISCAPSFDAAYASATAGKSGRELYDELLRLDQAYPGRLRLKLELGSRLLAEGDFKGARTYLDQGEKLLRPISRASLKYSLFADQAALLFLEGGHKDALAYASKALAVSPQDELGVVFTKAKAEAALKDKAQALKDFDKGWADHKAGMSDQDYRFYLEALLEAGRDADALALLGEYQKAYPYDAGLGIVEAGCRERLGDSGGAALALFKEYEHARALCVINDAALVESLDAAVKKSPPESRKSVESLVSCLKAFAARDWKKAAGISVKGFGEYIALASKLEEGSPTNPELEGYLLLEPSLKSFQAYYYHLWRGMRRLSASYSTRQARPLLEKCISLSPSSSMARESRRELGRLIGIGEAPGEKLLVPDEIEAIFDDLIAGGSFSALEPVMALLETPDNDYQLACVTVLGRLSADPALRSYLASKAKASSGKLRERLAYALSL